MPGKSLTAFSALSFALFRAEAANWYDGIDSIKVLSPDDTDAQKTVDAVFDEMNQDAHGDWTDALKGQFSGKRYAILLKQGNYDNLNVRVNWYTTLAGVGATPADVTLPSFSSMDPYPGTQKGGLENFWRSVEGLTTTADNITWAVSQAAPLRRTHVTGDLFLSETQNDGQAHYTSGGFMSDVVVDGTLNWGTQQQFLMRGCRFGNVEYGGGESFVFVGVEGAPDYNPNKTKPFISNVPAAPFAAEKPYLVEKSGDWSIMVPNGQANATGPSIVFNSNAQDFGETISMDDVFVAKEGDSAKTINDGMKGKKALLLTPAIYGLEYPVRVTQDNFVVLGIGMPTLVTTRGFAGLRIEADNVHVAGVLVESGTGMTPDDTEPLVVWKGDYGFSSDIFTRVGAFSYSTSFKDSCKKTQANWHYRVDGDNLIIDNSWLWHADHDDCTVSGPHEAPPTSDECFSGVGLLVNGDNVTAYGLASEHMKHNLVEWLGEDGKVFFFQSELPYNEFDFGKNGFVGYKVAYDVQRHTGYGIGVYMVFDHYNIDAAMRLPASAELYNSFAWCITCGRSQFSYLGCVAPGTGTCFSGTCDGNSCYVFSLNSSIPSGMVPHQIDDARAFFV